MKVLVVKIGALGDVVRTTCILKPLHIRFPKVEVVWITALAASPLLSNNPLIARVIPFEKFNGEKLGKFDWILNLEEDEKAADIVGSLQSPDRFFGVYRNREGKIVYTKDSSAWFDMGLLNRGCNGSLEIPNRLKAQNKRSYQNILLSMLGLSDQEGDRGELLVFPDEMSEHQANNFAIKHDLEGKLVIGVNTGSGGRWPSKQLSIGKTVELCTLLHRQLRAKVLLLGGPEERERNKKIISALSDVAIDTGTENSLSQFISLINLCGVVITSDSLALHLAMGLKKKIVAFFGPTPSVEIPLNEKDFLWQSIKKCECFYLPRCLQDQACLESLDAEDVLHFIQNDI